MPAVDPHYLWAFGHGVMLVSAAYVLLQTVLFRPSPTKSYKLAFTGALLSYSIVVYKSLGKPQLNQAWLRRALVDENVQYAILALYWWVAKPVNVSILPFATFSLFHCLTFLRTNIIPKLVPPPPQGTQGQAQAQTPPVFLETISRKIQLWVKSNYDVAMRFVAYCELLICVRLILGVLTFRQSFIAPLFMVHFVRLRYHASPFTKSAITNVTSYINNFVVGKPPVVQNVWNTLKRVIATWGGAPLIAGQGQAQGQGPAAAQAQAGRR
ncbi:endoplasmic reticulum protein [Kwoniella mangroviensis CBS 8886]|uniref:uncharacterized protein n=1 Tax=Kwoniella mangroviensis CBS 8507 TaxID=1296122 RepID=UPI00080CE399|nr:endoplasmic reticulum protein [Kwoniella mangroviensis CBS 8507]OCF64039.1 endoplasmic reticulum protein [Kwoniella mangroviensis CBS 8507]OCF73782.1 endoplasmic reticulum protein [Kwoniella mangroviensis CBS 8886]